MFYVLTNTEQKPFVWDRQGQGHIQTHIEQIGNRDKSDIYSRQNTDRPVTTLYRQMEDTRRIMKIQI